MAKIRQRKGQRYVTKTGDVVLIEKSQCTQLLKGRLVDESKGGICVAVDGTEPELAPNEKIRVRCRAGSGRAEVRYLEEDATSYRVGLKWMR